MIQGSISEDAHHVQDYDAGIQALESPSSLSRSLTGLLRPRARPKCYLFTNAYSVHVEHEDETVRSMSIEPSSIDKDEKRLRGWTRRFYPKTHFRYYCDQEGSRRADDTIIRDTLRTTRSHPTLVYIAGHTESLNQGPPTESSTDQLAYAPADYLDTLSSGRPKLIPYGVMRQSLLNGPQSESLLFITEVCFCDNFLQLPYALEYEGNEFRWKETRYHGTFTGASEIVHFAATSPGEHATWFRSTGAVFTQALCAIDPREALSLKDIAKRLQTNFSMILPPGCAPQHPKIYCSSKMEKPHFFAAFGFCASSADIEDNSDTTGR